MRGIIDDVTRDRISGWAFEPDAPGVPVSLLISAGDTLLVRVLADRQRADLREAGFGDGHHAFEIELKGLSPLERHVISVRREGDGAHLEGSPALIEPAVKFDKAFQAQCAALLADAPDDETLTERLRFLAEQTEKLLQQRARRRGKRAERIALRQIKWRWRDTERNGIATPRPEPLPPRALFIDEVAPLPSRDAGSNAALSHMRALRRLGFEVVFAAADMAIDPGGLLEELGVGVCQAPWHGSIEEVLRREAECFDLVYLHRGSMAARYLVLVRAHQPKARLVFSVADLHHLRLARQAKLEDRPELLALARQFQTSELRAAASADAVITHSSYEAALIRQQLPAARVHVVPWAVPVRETATPFADRRGFAFFGHYGHAPNLDAAQWLIDDILPAVRELLPEIPFMLAGSDMPEVLRREHPGVEVVGQVASLSEIFDRVRLTIAPMTYGAGVKGKVLESLAAGIPCVCTPIAVEGLDLPAPLSALVAADEKGLAALVARLHDDETFNRECAQAGLAYAASALSEARIDALMREVAALPAARPGVAEAELAGA